MMLNYPHRSKFRWIASVFLIACLVVCSKGEGVEFKAPSERKSLGDVDTGKQMGHPSVEELTDAGDHYLLGKNQRVALLRSMSEVLVGFEDGVTAPQGLHRLQHLSPFPGLDLLETISFRAKGRLHLLRISSEVEVIDVRSVLTQYSLIPCQCVA